MRDNEENGSQSSVESILSVMSVFDITDPDLNLTTHNLPNPESLIPTVSLNAIGSLGLLCEPFVPDLNQSVTAWLSRQSTHQSVDTPGHRS